jgi:diguanylate cyclase (GGDEF)-like protein
VSGRLWIGWLAVGTLGACTPLVMPSGSLPGDLSYVAVGVLSVLTMLIAVLRFRPPRARVWYLLVAGQALSVLGDATWTYFVQFRHEEPYPSIADAVYLAGYPLMAAGLLILIRSRAAGRDRDGLIDASMATVGLALLTWVLVIRPLTTDASLALSELSVSLSYPLVDVLLLAMVFRLLTTPGSRTASFRLLVGAMLLVLGSDIAFAMVTAVGEYTGGLMDVAWLLSYVLWGAAALHPSMRSLSLPPPDRRLRLTWARVAAIAATSQVIPLVLMYQGVTDPAEVDWEAISLASVVLFLLVTFRVSGLLTRVRRQAELLRTLANNDELTGLPNRRAWDAAMTRAVARAGRTGEPLVVGLLDLDRFKRFNDNFGHQAGDRLLKEAAAAWRSGLRAGDELARYGGEEFAILIGGLSLERAGTLVERLLAATPHGQTFSAGLARWDGVETPDELLARADRALYRGKDAGRARVVRGDAPADQPPVVVAREVG